MKTEQGYKTKQRRLVEDCLKDNINRHLTVDEIVDSLKASGADVGRTTVYRTLEKLVGENKVRKFVLPQGDSSCFQYIDSDERQCIHFHLKCNACGRLYHMECEQMQNLSHHIEAHHGFKVDSLKTVLYGTCQECEAAK